MRASKWWIILAASLLLLLALSRSAHGQVSDPLQYKLYPGSYFEYGCFGPCACPVAVSDPLRGSFTFYRTSIDPLFTRFVITNIDWTYTFGDSGTATARTVHLAGHGTYEIGGEVALTQRMSLNLSSNGALEQKFDSGVVPVGADFPAISIDVHARTGACLDSILHVLTAPLGFATIGPPAAARLIERAMPNPTHAALDVVLALHQNERVRVDVVDVGGRVVAMLADREMSAGEQRIRWNGRTAQGADAGSGLFWIRARVGSRLDQARVVRFK